MTLSRFFHFVLLMSLFCSCTRSQPFEGSYFQPMQPQSTDKEIQVPTLLIGMIEKHYIDTVKRETTGLAKTDAEILIQVPRKYLSMKVRFYDPHQRALKHNYEMEMPRGGGAIDLKEIVFGSYGSFDLAVNVEKETGSSQDMEGLKVYYLSNANQRRLDGEKYGAGCNKLIEITSLYKTRIISGLKLNATKQRYLSVVGGTFYFVWPSQGVLNLGTLSLGDSRYPNLLCKPS